jgi:Contractile injection system tube protein/LysM domain
MERAAFLIEETGERISCLLNPENVTLKRIAGVQPRYSIGGQLSGQNQSDDPLLFTGGGRTELELELLFDVTLTGSTIVTDDVRELTRPLWQMAENTNGKDGYGRIPEVRFVWGKPWNILGVIVALSEKLEHFTMGGAPQRSWLRLRLLRVNEDERGDYDSIELNRLIEAMEAAELTAGDEEDVTYYEASADGENEADGNSGTRLYMLSHFYLGSAMAWRVIARFNNISNPHRISAGTVLQIPPVSAVGRANI